MVVTALWSTLCIGSPVNCAAIFTAELYNIHDRLGDYFTFAHNPIAPSYNEEAVAVRYRQKH